MRIAFAVSLICLLAGEASARTTKFWGSQDNDFGGAVGLGPITAAELAMFAPRDGFSIYCKDCNTSCGGGGVGNEAFRMHGTWNCNFGTAGSSSLSSCGTEAASQLAFFTSPGNLCGDFGLTWSSISGVLAAFIARAQMQDTGGTGQMVNIIAYGADNTGVTDISTIVNTLAIPNLPVGGTVYFPPGTYLVSAPIHLIAGYRYLGSGQGTTILKTESSAGVGYPIFQNVSPRTCTGGAGSCDAPPLTGARGAGCACYTNGAFGDCTSGVCAGGVSQQGVVIEGMDLFIQRTNSWGIDFGLISESKIRDVNIIGQGLCKAGCSNAGALCTAGGTCTSCPAGTPSCQPLTGTVGVFFSDGNAAVSGGAYGNVIDSNHISRLDNCLWLTPQANHQKIINNSFSNACNTAVLISSNTNGNKVNSTMLEGNTIEGERDAGIDDHGIGTMIGTGNRFEFVSPSTAPGIKLEADGEGAQISNVFFSNTGTRIVDLGMPYWNNPGGNLGSYTLGQSVGVSSQPAPQLFPDGTVEVWPDANHVRGWTFIKNGSLTNWDNVTSTITQEATIKHFGAFSAKVGCGAGASALCGAATAVSPHAVSDCPGGSACSFPIDPSYPYTMSFWWTTPCGCSNYPTCSASTDTGCATIPTDMRYCLRLFDSSGAVITTGTVFSRGPVPAGLDLNNFVTADLSYVAGFNAHCGGTNLFPVAANTMERRVTIFKFPVGVAAARFAIRAGGSGATTNSYVYIDDLYFAQGMTPNQVVGRPITDDGDALLYKDLFVPNIASATGNYCLQVDTTGKVTNTGVACSAVAPQIPFSATNMILPSQQVVTPGSTTSTASTANQLVCIRFIPSRTLTNAIKLGWRVEAGQAAANCSVCIYSDDGATKLADSGVKSCASSTTNVSANPITAFTLVAAVPYWQCWITDTASVTFNATTNSPPVASLFNLFTVNEGLAGAASAGGACPATRPSLGAGSAIGNPMNLIVSAE